MPIFIFLNLKVEKATSKTAGGIQYDKIVRQSRIANMRVLNLNLAIKRKVITIAIASSYQDRRYGKTFRDSTPDWAVLYSPSQRSLENKSKIIFLTSSEYPGQNVVVCELWFYVLVK